MSASYFDRLEAELRAAVPRATGGAAGSRHKHDRWWPRAGDLGLVVGVAATLVVVVLFVVPLLSNRHAPPQRPMLRHRVGTAAPSVVTGIDLFRMARQNVRDAPLRLFEHNPAAIGAVPTPRETVIPSTVRTIGTFTVAGYGHIQDWVASTRQRGICTALRFSDGSWVGLTDGGRDGGSLPGCWATRAQVGAGALILDGFDYIESTLPARHGGPRYPRYIIYGAITTPQAPVRVRDSVSGTDAALVSGHYFAIVLRPVGNDYGDQVHLEAFNASGQRVASEDKPLPSTPTGR